MCLGPEADGIGGGEGGPLALAFPPGDPRTNHSIGHADCEDAQEKKVY